MRPAGYAFGTNPPGREIGTNGLTFDKNGTLVVADHGNRGISRWNDSLFTRTVVVDRFEGKRFNSPNDLVWAPNGDLYFTDPSYGLRGLNADPAKELPFNGVFRLSASGRAERGDARSHLPERRSACRPTAARSTSASPTRRTRTSWRTTSPPTASSGRGASSSTDARACSRSCRAASTG